MGRTAIMWFRRDLRLADNPALLAAVAEGGHVAPVFVLDPRLWDVAGEPRRAYLIASLRALREATAGQLIVRIGRPDVVLPSLTSELHASSVHISADFGSYGQRRDSAVAAELQRLAVPLVATGSPYAVSPGRLHTRGGTPFQVFSAFRDAWLEHGWRGPAANVAPQWVGLTSDAFPVVGSAIDLPGAGETAARQRWASWLAERLDGYATDRDRPDLAGASRMSAHLRWGEIHPRTMLADLLAAGGPHAQKYRHELAWREFYAHVLYARPETATEPFNPRFAGMRYDSPDRWFTAWTQGKTGFPLVDAGMRQLAETGWMHNRVRMVTASFLVKDLHIDWRHGARHFMRHLLDADLASNQHGWQWVAGCGTDAAPYFRIFNPTTQARTFDPRGNYIRSWIPELAEVSDRQIHEPGAVNGYPAPIVDHANERREALARLAELS